VERRLPSLFRPRVWGLGSPRLAVIDEDCGRLTATCLSPCRASTFLEEQSDLIPRSRLTSSARSVSSLAPVVRPCDQTHLLYLHSASIVVPLPKLVKYNGRGGGPHLEGKGHSKRHLSRNNISQTRRRLT